MSESGLPSFARTLKLKGPYDKLLMQNNVFGPRSIEICRCFPYGFIN